MTVNEDLGFRHYVLIGLGAVISLILVIVALYLVFVGPNWIRYPFWIAIIIIVVILVLALIGYWITRLWSNA